MAAMTSDRKADDEQAEVAAFLADPANHDSAEQVKRIDTHAAIVFLAGPIAYKVNRAVAYPFLDFSSLEKRRTACAREVEFNKANAPQIYDRIIPITRRRDGGLEFDGGGNVVEWAVRMNRFDETKTLDKIIKAGPLSRDVVDALAHEFVLAHARAPIREAAAWIDDLCRYVKQNAEAFNEHPDLYPAEKAKALTESSTSEHGRIRPLLESRGQAGHIRLCHGDAHLGNIVLIDDKPVLFDAIEFDDVIATSDVLYDLAFLLMDLWERGHRLEANRILNRYLTDSDCKDHQDGLAAMPFFLMMRSAIRSKVTASRREFHSGAKRNELEQEARAYFNAAIHFLEKDEPVMIAVGGLSGTGKTTVAARIAADIGMAPGAVILRSDIIRKHLAGVDEFERLPESAYTRAISADVYRLISEASNRILKSGHSVVVDAVFADPTERADVSRIAEDHGVRFVGLWLDAPTEVLMARVDARRGDASDADRTVVLRQSKYDLGEITWRRIDATGSVESTAQSALKSIGT